MTIATVQAKVIAVGGAYAELEARQPAATKAIEVRLPLAREEHQALGMFLYREVEIVVRKPGLPTWDELAAAAAREKLELKRHERDGFTVEVQLLWTVGLTAGQPAFVLRAVDLGPEDSETTLRRAAAAVIAALPDEETAAP
jgi:hypothetical protein